jgi:hypothetical protein
MEQVFENADIMRYIYSFGYVGHRTYMKQLSYELDTRLDSFDNLDPIGWMENRIRGESLCEFLHREKTYDELVDLYHMYKNCHCCTRHCHYKPNFYEMDENTKPEPNPHYTTAPNGKSKRKYHGCLCKCRVNIRHVYTALVNK